MAGKRVSIVTSARAWIGKRGLFVPVYAMAVAAGLVLFALRHVDANWDLRNYHIAGPYLALSGVAWEHVLPSGIQTYFPALFYLPTYLGLTYLGPAVWRLVLVGWQALFWPIMLGIFWMVLKRESVAAVRQRPIATFLLLVALAGVSGMSLSVLGTTFADLSLAVVIAAAVARALQVGFRPQVRRGVEIGVLLGIAVGLKSTSIVAAAPFAVAFYGTLLLVAGRPADVLKEFAAFAGVAFACVLALMGYWMIEVYGVTGNPAFPYANAIFRSPLAAPSNWSDTHFLPTSLRGWIGRPARLAASQSYLISEESFRDIRYALFFYVVAPLGLIGLFATRRGRVVATARAYPYTLCLTVFHVIGIVLWAKLFSIGRYMPLFELLTGFLILRPLLAVRGSWGIGVAAILAAAHLATTCVPDWGSLPRTADGSSRYAAARPGFGRAMVFLGDPPMGYVLPYLGPRSRAVLRLSITAADSFYAAKVRALLAQRWPDGVWYVSTPGQSDDGAPYLAGYGLAATRQCVPLPTWYAVLRACRVVPAA